VAVPGEDRMMWRWLRANWARLVCGLALAAVAAVAGIISYDHIESLTLALHQAVIVARLMPDRCRVCRAAHDHARNRVDGVARRRPRCRRVGIRQR